METKAKKYLETLSNTELDSIYTVLVRGTGNAEPNNVIKLIEQIIVDRLNKHENGE